MTTQGLAWVSTKFTNRSLDYPDIEFHFVSGSPGSDGGRQIRKVRERFPVIFLHFDTWSWTLTMTSEMCPS